MCQYCTLDEARQGLSPQEEALVTSMAPVEARFAQTVVERLDSARTVKAYNHAMHTATHSVKWSKANAARIRDKAIEARKRLALTGPAAGDATPSGAVTRALAEGRLKKAVA